MLVVVIDVGKLHNMLKFYPSINGSCRQLWKEHLTRESIASSHKPKSDTSICVTLCMFIIGKME